MTKSADVILISSPFAPITVPSIGLSLLKGALERMSVSSRLLYFNLSFASLIGEDAYRSISEETDTTFLAGEWVFAEDLSGRRCSSDTTEYVDNILRRKVCNDLRDDPLIPTVAESTINEMLHARTLVDSFMSECVRNVLSYNPLIVGFTSVFQQHVAALALARRLKAAKPSLHIVFGGGNCEGVMGRELIRQFTFVDIVVSGEADEIFPSMVSTILTGQKVVDSDVVFTQAGKQERVESNDASNVRPTQNLDELPFADYDDYFDQIDTLFDEPDFEQILLVETARGCWWGAKHHCTFCGLNGTSMAFRSKSAGRAISEIIRLAEKYPGKPIHAVDNILDMKYFTDVLPGLIEREIDLHLDYEVKSNLTRQQLTLLKQAGIASIQPGIESFSDNVLNIMRKGVTGLQNIQLLKWCAELGITPTWNLIWGFPGESAEDYHQMEPLVPLLTHLHPPYATARIRLDRFSPNYERAAELGFSNVAPCLSYSYVYPTLSKAALDNLAYFFNYEYASPRDVTGYTSPIANAVRNWVDCHETSKFFCFRNGDRLVMWDSRPVSRQRLAILEGFERLCYEACDGVTSALKISRNLARQGVSRANPQEIEKTLISFCENGLAVTHGGRYLALALRPQLAPQPGDSILDSVELLAQEI